MSSILLDTHTFIWYIDGSAELTKPIIRQINQSIQNHSLYIAAISMWEITMLESKNRIRLGMSCLEWMNKAIEITHTQIIPLTPTIAYESCHLPGNFHEDPADRLIVATARIESLTIFTRDSRILNYGKEKYVSTTKI